MLDSLFKKMFVLSTTTMILTLFIVVSFFKINEQQKVTKIELDQIIDLQLCVDLLRSQLWVFKQFGDASSLDQVEVAQAELSTKLTVYKASNIQLDNIQRMNHSLHTLLMQEKEFFPVSHSEINNETVFSLNGQSLLHSRYNMIIQNMTEELAYVHQRVLNRNASSLENVMSTTAAWLILCSILVSVTAWLILFRFKSGAEAMKAAILNLAKGQLDTKVEAVQMDSEFRVIASFFNQMTVSLCRTTVTKQELEEEIIRQTKQLKHKQEQLLFLSEHDPLTNLMNRRAFDKQVELSIVKANRTGHKFAILFIDLDDFKNVNDRYGHEAGDYVLVQIAERLSDCVRESDVVGRLGGDEFVVCLDLLKDLEGVPSKIEQISQVIKSPIKFGGNTLSVGSSIGIACFPEQGTTKDELICIADKAMYVQKECKDQVLVDGDNNQISDHLKNVVELFAQGDKQ
ncbi:MULTISPECIES: diguanylate cyclase domain-containing protein [Vibrio]|uniref:Diguanylate cyclase n=1 Tax=Vibrio bivalvicida TaxID=1276888 RepID=A0A177Y2T0_9VIBR|nr:MULTISPECIES: diguanylate cyclase [Vibrio]KLN63442.1 diguanylate cyclase [Vibrio sp. VPAP30]OAJ95168.1 diguanylate cyclase [Vibrio bivalvicida]